MKVHIGCGTVYLDGWVNLDLPGPHTYLASNRPDLVERWRTTEDKYFAKHPNASVETLRKPSYQEYVCDRFANFENLPFPAWTVDEILARHAFEHLSITEAHKALDQIDEVLKEGGLLRLDVPDHGETVRLLRETGDAFYERHLLGPRRNDHGFHMMSYTRDRLRRLVEEHGFVFVKEEPNIHFYPAFCLRFVKPGLRPPCEYVELPAAAKNATTFLDVGPGPFPHPKATHYLDLNPANLKPLSDKGKSTILADIATGCPRIESKQFDYVWCSHVLEHSENPRQAALTLSRIAKRGTLVLPSVIKESLFNFEESDHKWLILPAPNAEGPVFVRHDADYMKAVKNENVQRITCRLFRSGPNRIDPDQRFLRSWYFRNEVHLDVVHHWEGELKIQVIG